MKRKLNLNFFDISNDLEILPENELFKIKGGNSDMMDGGEIEEVVVEGEYEGEEDDDYDDGWDDWDDWNEGSDPEDDDGWDNDIDNNESPDSGTGPGQDTIIDPEKILIERFKNALKSIIGKELSPIELARMIGGKVEFNFVNDPINFKDTCAIKVSLALNAAGGDFSISTTGHPDLNFISGDWNDDTVKEQYLYKAADMYTYLTKEFGQGVEYGSASEIPKGAEGFIYYENFQGTDRRYDHIDYWEGGEVPIGGYDYSGQDGNVYFIRTN